MSYTVTDETRAILAEPKTWDNLDTLIEYTKKHGFDVVQGFIEFNGGHWSAEDFEYAHVGRYEGWIDLFLEHVLGGVNEIDGVDIWDVLDEEKVRDGLIEGNLDGYHYFGVATGFCVGEFFKKKEV